MEPRIYQEENFLHPDRGVDLETRAYFLDKESPMIVFSVGLGGSAAEDSSAQNLTSRLVKRGYQVKVFSPRNSGKSTGHLTIDNYISNNELVLEDTAQKQGELPFAIGHSLGGYSLARILGRENLSKKAVLLAPLAYITEQNPEIVNVVLRNKKGKKIVSHFLSLLGLDEQRFSGSESASQFLESLYTSVPCTSKLKVSTYILLPGRTNFGFAIKNMEQLEMYWKRLQSGESRTETYYELDHFFTEQIIPSGKNFFRKSEQTRQILDNIADFLR